MGPPSFFFCRAFSKMEQKVKIIMKNNELIHIE